MYFIQKLIQQKRNRLVLYITKDTSLQTQRESKESTGEVNQLYCCENIRQTTQEEEQDGQCIFGVESWWPFAVMEDQEIVDFWRINFDKIKVFDKHLTFNVDIFNL